ncbi:MAG: hypothetical protein AUK36_00100 [Zetaproteobacteria bacterium CG2_30_59_37]|nr:MAG: hypothetical protein AUK36_00100 [Zetaproteobacteria bacterium CG2_30_59_37]
MHPLRYRITATVWKYQGKAAWFFITLPQQISDEIRFFTADRKSAWGSVRVEACLGDTRWSTSLFRDAKLDAYVLPIKAGVRKQEDIQEGSSACCELTITL